MDVHYYPFVPLFFMCNATDFQLTHFSLSEVSCSSPPSFLKPQEDNETTTTKTATTDRAPIEEINKYYINSRVSRRKPMNLKEPSLPVKLRNDSPIKKITKKKEKGKENRTEKK